MRKKRKYWMFRNVCICPACQGEKVNLERRYDKKPKNPSERESVIEFYDWCLE